MLGRNKRLETPLSPLNPEAVVQDLSERFEGNLDGSRLPQLPVGGHQRGPLAALGADYVHVGESTAGDGWAQSQLEFFLPGGGKVPVTIRAEEEPAAVHLVGAGPPVPVFLPRKSWRLTQGRMAELALFEQLGTEVARYKGYQELPDAEAKDPAALYASGQSGRLVPYAQTYGRAARIARLHDIAPLGSLPVRLARPLSRFMLHELAALGAFDAEYGDALTQAVPGIARPLATYGKYSKYVPRGARRIYGAHSGWEMVPLAWITSVPFIAGASIGLLTQPFSDLIPTGAMQDSHQSIRYWIGTSVMLFAFPFDRMALHHPQKRAVHDGAAWRLRSQPRSWPMQAYAFTGMFEALARGTAVDTSGAQLDTHQREVNQALRAEIEFRRLFAFGARFRSGATMLPPVVSNQHQNAMRTWVRSWGNPADEFDNVLASTRQSRQAFVEVWRAALADVGGDESALKQMRERLLPLVEAQAAALREAHVAVQKAELRPAKEIAPTKVISVRDMWRSRERQAWYAAGLSLIPASVMHHPEMATIALLGPAQSSLINLTVQQFNKRTHASEKARRENNRLLEWEHEPRCWTNIRDFLATAEKRELEFDPDPELKLQPALRSYATAGAQQAGPLALVGAAPLLFDSTRILAWGMIPQALLGAPSVRALQWATARANEKASHRGQLVDREIAGAWFAERIATETAHLSGVERAQARLDIFAAEVTASTQASQHIADGLVRADIGAEQSRFLATLPAELAADPEVGAVTAAVWQRNDPHLRPLLHHMLSSADGTVAGVRALFSQLVGDPDEASATRCDRLADLLVKHSASRVNAVSDALLLMEAANEHLPAQLRGLPLFGVNPAIDDPDVQKLAQIVLNHAPYDTGGDLLAAAILASASAGGISWNPAERTPGRVNATLFPQLLAHAIDIVSRDALRVRAGGGLFDDDAFGKKRSEKAAGRHIAERLRKPTDHDARTDLVDTGVWQKYVDSVSQRLEAERAGLRPSDACGASAIVPENLHTVDVERLREIARDYAERVDFADRESARTLAAVQGKPLRELRSRAQNVLADPELTGAVDYRPDGSMVFTVGPAGFSRDSPQPDQRACALLLQPSGESTVMGIEWMYSPDVSADAPRESRKLLRAWAPVAGAKRKRR